MVDWVPMHLIPTKRNWPPQLMVIDVTCKSHN